MSTKSKMAPVFISQNDNLALSLLCITILRRRIRHRTRVGKRRTRYLFSYLYHNILLILYSILLNHFNKFFYHVICLHFFSFGSHPANSAFPAVFTMGFLFGKQNCIIPKLNSHQSPSKFQVKQDEILFHQSPSKFLIKVFFDRCHCPKNPSKTLIMTTGLY